MTKNKTKKIVLFNHKGGVSKTTSTYNIAWMVAELGHKVLLVDADPQCNLTTLVLGNRFDEYYEDKATSNINLMDGVKNAFSGKPYPIEALDCPVIEQNKNLSIIPGHMNLSEYEAQLSFAFNASSAMISLQSLPGAFNDLIEKTAQKINAEYVFIDLNPSLSTINQDFFLISDAFVVPMNPDTFSLMAIKSLAIILPRWVNWKNANVNLFNESAYPLPMGTPKFIGAIAQRFNIRNGKATTPYREKIEELTAIITNEFVPKLNECNMMYCDELYTRNKIDTSSFILSEIKDYQGLSPKSLGANVPIYKLNDEQLGTTGAALEAQRNNVKEFYEVYRDLALKIVGMVQDE